MKRGPLGVVWLGMTLGLLACSPPEEVRGQVVLAFTTDAPLPHEDPSRPAPLFDRLRIDVFFEGQPAPCETCTRIVALTEEAVEREGVSLGIVTEEGGAVVRARLYRRAGQLDDEPTVAGSVEAWVQAPMVGKGEVLPLWFSLPTERVAQPLGSREEPVSGAEGLVPAGVVGGWTGAERVPCTRAARPGEVCVPGGAFWMGSEKARGFFSDDVVPERLVVLSPFFIQSHEVSGGTLRDAGIEVTGVGLYTGTPDGDEAEDWCSYAPDESRDELPLNCVLATRASQLCRELGGAEATLPSEAQFEYAAGALASRLYPWGESEPGCDEAIFGLVDSYARFIDVVELGICPTKGIGGPRATHRADHGRDVVSLEGGDIFDLAGNVAEYVRDRFAPYGDGCWPTGVLTDPVCTDGLGIETTVKGGAWSGARERMRAAARQPSEVDQSPVVGFRCVRPGQ